MHGSPVLIFHLRSRLEFESVVHFHSKWWVTSLKILLFTSPKPLV